MRWFVWVVALCRLAAGVARPLPTLTFVGQDTSLENASRPVVARSTRGASGSVAPQPIIP